MDVSTSPNASLSPSGVRKRYKSCRICRKRKLRCNGQSPCERCRGSGTTCIYDSSAGRQRQTIVATDDQSQQIQSLRAQLQSIQEALHRIQAPPLALRETLGSGDSNIETGPTSPDCEVLSPNDLELPWSAVHVMLRPAPRGEPQRNREGWTPSNQSRWNREEYHVASAIEKDLVDESQARNLFGSFMQHCNIATPVFDPVLDTFEVLSEQYPLTLTIILYLAARHNASNKLDHDRQSLLELETKQLAAETLFENPCSLDSVQAMLLLAVHAEKTWFALGHTHQMALDLGLGNSLQHALANPEDCTRYDFRCARIWLFVVYFERAIAHGSTRIARCEPISPEILEKFVGHRYAHPSDIFFCASLELFDMSAVLRQIAAVPTAETLERQLALWVKKWTAHFDKQCIHASSLQRVHLTVQMLLAKTWQLGIVLGRGLKSEVRNNDTSLLDQIILTNHELFAYVSESEAYKRYFPWSPTCEALLLTFTIVLGRKALSMNPSAEKQNQFAEASSPVATLLREHPCRQFSRVVDDLLRSIDMPRNTAPPADGISMTETSWMENGWTMDTQFEDFFGDWTGSWANYSGQ